MNGQDPLAQLHPLREPALSGWWPPAPGWWLLAGLALLILCWLFWKLYRAYRANAYRRQALAQLARIRVSYEARGDTERCLSEINALLKSVALQAFPRRQVASISGQPWIEFLNQHGAPAAQIDAPLATAHYTGCASEAVLEDALDKSARWIKSHRAPQ